MSDYISREAAIEKIRVAAGCAECAGSSSALCVCNVCDVYNAIRLVKSLPAADVEPVRYGKWVHSEIEDDDWGRTFHEWTCSVCGYSVAHNPTGENYCPNCGAKMDKEETNELD